MAKNKEGARLPKAERIDVISRYDLYTRDALVAVLDREIAGLPEEVRASVMFEIDMDSEPYDPSQYPRLFMTWQRPETDAEMEARYQQANLRLLHERREFERLQKIYGEKK